MSAVQQNDLATVNLGANFQITPYGLCVIGTPGFDVFEALGKTLRTLSKSIQFAVGDYFREVETRFGEHASQLLDHTEWSDETLRTYRWASKNVPQNVRRMDKLTYSHHQAVGRLPPREQKKWLDRAADDPDKPWSVTRLKKAMKIGADPAVTAWYFIAKFESEAARDDTMKELESRGITCTTSEKRG